MTSSSWYYRDGTPVPESELTEYFKEWEDPDQRRVATTQFRELWISTVFLGLDHRFGDGPPLLFETMVFAEDTQMQDLDGLTERYESEAAALEGHERIVKLAKRQRRWRVMKLIKFIQRRVQGVPRLGPRRQARMGTRSGRAGETSE